MEMMINNRPVWVEMCKDDNGTDVAEVWADDMAVELWPDGYAQDYNTKQPVAIDPAYLMLFN